MTTIFIAGAGLMGHGIAQVAAASGHRVLLYDLNEEARRRALERIAWSLEKLHAKNPATTAAPGEALARVSATGEPEAAKEADFVIEAIAENAGAKQKLFRALDEMAPAKTIFCTNTSAIPIGRLAAESGRPDRFCGMHFFSPVPLMALVEVIRAETTSAETARQVTELARAMGKEPVEVRRDVPGFIVNRLLLASIIEAVRLLETGVASAEDIDRAMRLGCGHKMGPLETADFTGLDVILHAIEAIHEAEGDSKYVAPALLRELVSGGRLGKKSGGGFYS